MRAARALQASRNTIPPQYQVIVNLPPQQSLNATLPAEEFVETVGEPAKPIFFTSLLFATLFNLSLQALWGGVNALQIIAHLPLNNVNFSNNAFIFFQFLAEVVSFDLFAPTDHIDFGLTETAPYNANHDGLGYESSNFYENLGSIAVIGVVIALRQLLQPPLFYLFQKVGCGLCCRRAMRRHGLSGPRVSNMWIRYGLETYFEFLISCLVGLRLSSVLPSPPTGPDKFTIASTYFFTVLACAFPIGIAFITLWWSRAYVRKQKEEREINMNEAVRKLYEKEKHAQQIAYGPHLFFRTVAEHVVPDVETNQSPAKS